VLSSITLLASGKSLAGIQGRAHDSVVPLKVGGKKIVSPIERLIAKMSIDDLRKDNARLRRELDAATVNDVRYRDAVRQRKQLLELQGLVDPDGFNSVAARVISVGTGNFDDTIEVDVGTNDDVVEGATVVTGAGLVGRVDHVSPEYSSVILISDGESNVGIRLANEGDVGLAKGSADDGPIRIDLIALDTAVAKSDVVVTSGLNRSSFPPGIPVGRVATVKAGPIQKEITITPIADLKHLEFVKVLLPKSTVSRSPGRSGSGSSS
jgi:rod shape-determining protein MreC